MTLSIFLLAIGAPFLWALVNHADKYLIDKFFGEREGGGVGGLMIFSTLFSVVLLPFIYWMDPNVLDISMSGAFLLILAGASNAIAILLYLYALNEDETTVVVPFMQLIPIFSFVFGYLVLGELITGRQMLGGLVIILGAAFIAVGGIHKGQRIHFKSKVVTLMTAHSALFGLYGILFKLVSLGEGFWSGAFWEAIGLIAVGLVLYAIPSYRADFFHVIRGNSKVIIGVNLMSEALTILGNWLSAYASLFAKIALVTLIAGFQPVFVFVLGLITTLFFPRVAREDIEGRVLVQKIIALVVILAGSCLIY